MAPFVNVEYCVSILFGVFFSTVVMVVPWWWLWWWWCRGGGGGGGGAVVVVVVVLVVLMVVVSLALALVVVIVVIIFMAVDNRDTAESVGWVTGKASGRIPACKNFASKPLSHIVNISGWGTGCSTFWQCHLPVNVTEGQPAYPGSPRKWSLKRCVCTQLKVACMPAFLLKTGLTGIEHEK